MPSTRDTPFYIIILIYRYDIEYKIEDIRWIINECQQDRSNNRATFTHHKETQNLLIIGITKGVAKMKYEKLRR